jgi:hypothetical protein
MPEPVSDDQDNSAAEEIVLGVDTHKDIHVAAVITSLGVLRESTTFPATAAGYQGPLHQNDPTPALICRGTHSRSVGRAAPKARRPAHEKRSRASRGDVEDEAGG